MANKLNWCFIRVKYHKSTILAICKISSKNSNNSTIIGNLNFKKEKEQNWNSYL